MKVLAIGVSGGPASGINAAIRAVVNHGRHFDYEVLGLHDAFSRLTRKLPDAFEVLTPQRIEGISELAGSILGRSKPGIPTTDHEFDLILEGFRDRGVHDLIWIGGDDSSRILSRLIKHARKQNFELRVALIPKTIDNDVYLTSSERSFEESTLGFSSAALAGTRSVNGFLADAVMSNKWWLWVAMGRSAGHLALAIYKRTEAEAFILGEELDENSSPDLVVDLLLGTMLKKAAKKNGGRYGVAIISENIIEKLALPQLNLTRSDMGNLNLGEFDLASFLAKELRKKCAALGFSVSIDSHAMGRDNRT
ncbi:MAG: 6-phosphofructokinase, partial [Bryobacterales bacterium]|nr:6-phosphofructokinase [Bryobacterales bacterium]